jgi:hypothetical protein
MIHISYLENHQIDKQKWNETIEKCDYGNAYSYSWYLDAIFPSWTALVGNDYEYVFPIMVKSKIGIKYFYTPIYGMQFGLFSHHPIKVEIQEQFWDSIPFKINAIDISLNVYNTFCPKKTTTFYRYCQFVSLNKSYEEISQHYNKNLKRNLAKATSLNLKIVESENIEDVVSFFIQGRGSKLNDLNEEHFQNLRTLVLNGIRENKIKIYECYEDREIIASGFFSFCNNKIIYHKGGANHKGKKYGAMHLMIDHILRTYQNSNYIFDFGGSSIENVKKFNKNFTEEEYRYPVLKKTNLILSLGRKYKNKLISKK